jgi:transcriptional regulator with PAS, ATPase and Fis domain
MKSTIVVGDLASPSFERLAERTLARGLRLEPSAVGPCMLASVVAFFESSSSAREFLRSPRLAPTFVVTAQDLSDDDARGLLSRGAADAVSLSDLDVDRLAQLEWLQDRWERVRTRLDSSKVLMSLIGQSCAWLGALREAIEAGAGFVSSVLVTGESGTGKEAVARLIHSLGYTARGQFVALNCGAIVDSLAGSELFGHRRGAFTGADRDREGAVALANGGTLFLDEIGELKLVTQAELLRVLEDGSYKPVGDDRVRASRFRLVAATHRNLEGMVSAGTFRGDLYHRIAGAICPLPALRERAGDLPLLVDHFLGQQLGTAPKVDAAVLRLLGGIYYAGNVRELRSVVIEIAGRYGGKGPVRLSHLPRRLLALDPATAAGSRDELERAIVAAVNEGATFADLVENVKDMIIRAALERAQGSAAEAGKLIDVSKRWVELRRRGPRKVSAGDELSEDAVS